ncbi:hypothetical protein KSF_107660 [Reticulibacter mediterranei]|uniref:Uncharacterized protein n=1 Tax=Reticulibacter mediterranei TaxID=2778369 RepID=A0A8J3N9F2_9CHLR|nr:hypothetical protein [Reticulibacter mediterranei]GHP00719.1 hypothetical protein KSF_107660 [Reticulibacter mediterranei]
MQSLLQRLRDELEHGPRISPHLPWDHYDYRLMASEAKNILNTSLNEREQKEAATLYEIATRRLHMMLQAEQDVAACDPEQKSLLDLAYQFGKEHATLIENPNDKRWHAEAYAWAIIRAMNGRFPSKIKKPSYPVFCQHLVSSYQRGVDEAAC